MLGESAIEDLLLYKLFTV